MNDCRLPACGRANLWPGFVWNGLWVLELAAVGDPRVNIEGDVKLELTSFRPNDSRFAVNGHYVLSNYRSRFRIGCSKRHRLLGLIWA